MRYVQCAKVRSFNFNQGASKEKYFPREKLFLFNMLDLTADNFFPPLNLFRCPRHARPHARRASSHRMYPVSLPAHSIPIMCWYLLLFSPFQFKSLHNDEGRTRNYFSFVCSLHEHSVVHSPCDVGFSPRS